MPQGPEPIVLLVGPGFLWVEEEEGSPPEAVAELTDAVCQSEYVLLLPWYANVLHTVSKCYLLHHTPRVLNCQQQETFSECRLGISGGRVLKQDLRAEYRRLVKSHQLLYCNKLFHVAEAKIIRHENRGPECKTISTLSVPKGKTKISKRLASGLVQQFSLPVSTAAEDLGPLVEAGGGRGEHDEELLLEA